MRRILLSALTLIPVALFAQDTKYTVQGNVGTFNKPAKVYLQYRKDGQSVTDSVTLKDGKFMFRGDVGKWPVSARLWFNANASGLNSAKDSHPLYLEPGLITLTTADLLANAKLDGPKTNQEYEQYHAALKVVSDGYDALDARDKTAGDAAKTDTFIRYTKLREKELSTLDKAINKQFIKDHPDSYISLTALRSYAYSADYADIAPLYDALTNEVKQSKDGKAFGDLMPKIKAVAIGATAPEFTEADTLGKKVSLSSFRGKYVLVDFWASWCGPCREENPNVVKAYGHYKDKNFTIVGISLDKPNAKKAWLDAIHKDGLAWTQLSDLKYSDSKVANLYGVKGIPQNFLIDPDGKIIAKNLRGDDLNNKLAELFGSLVQ